MGVTFTVLEAAGDFRMADFYEQVNSHSAVSDQGTTFMVDDQLTTATIYSGTGLLGAYFGGIDYLSPIFFQPLAILLDYGDPAGTTCNALVSALDAGQSGTQAMATVFAGDDALYGFRRNDELWGFAGDDRIVGMAGNDILHGGSGNDHLEGDRGTDMLHGGIGKDRFDYSDIVRGTAGGWGQDTIFDFRQGQDKIEFLDTIGIRRFSDLTITDNQGDAVVSNTAGDTITLMGVTAASLTAKDFAFIRPSQAPLDRHVGMRAHDALDWTHPHIVLA